MQRHHLLFDLKAFSKKGNKRRESGENEQRDSYTGELRVLKYKVIPYDVPSKLGKEINIQHKRQNVAFDRFRSY